MFAEDLGHSDPMDGRKALAMAFGAYVDDRGLTQTDVAAMGGPSTTSQTKIRKTDDPISRQTLQKIDKVTGWGPGTSARIIADGLEPSQQHTIEDYSKLELVDELRRRLLREGGSDAQAKPEQKMPTAGLEPAMGSTPLGRQQPVQEPDLQPTSDQHGPDSRR